jgi:3-oxoacyl-[acyl-carrier-protein] synthase-1
MGADVLSNFVLAGFKSLNAMSPQRCKPFDKNRTGISLGEAAATIVVSRDKQAGENTKVKIMGGGLSNDANHISGPSKTGEELAMAIDLALEESGVGSSAVDFISAHGTATLYNDEMEAKAFDHAGLSGKPVNSLKGSFGHTLGAAGLVESIMNIEGLINNEVLPTVGFENLGVSIPLIVSSKLKKLNAGICLKTSSGFGGCNAAIVFQKESA